MTGEIIAPKVVSVISQTLLRAYADASGDHNTIHQDEAAAKAAGLPGVIAHGMFIAGLVGERGALWISEHLSREIFENAWRPASFQSRFRAMTFLGDTVSVGGSVKSESETQITLELQAKNQKGDVLTSSILSFVRTT